jgi:hypothetical protein
MKTLKQWTNLMELCALPGYLLAALLFWGSVRASYTQPISSNGMSYSVSGPEVEGYRLTISTSNTTYAAGQFVPLAISVENLSTNASVIRERSGYWCYSFQVTGPGGSPAAITGYGTNALHPMGGGRNSPVQVPAGKSYTAHAALNLLFNLTNTGEYTVTVSRQVPKRKGPYQEVWVRSGPLKIVIAEPQKP